ncbi:hypothetical protein BH10BDE1_BH10BDE1_07220 [soil metagenome]
MRNSGLHVVKLSMSRERAARLESFDGQKTTWVVADVRSKLAIQKRLLEKTKFAEGNAVLRASELWSHALRRLEPDLQIVSRELIQASIAMRLRKREELWLQAPGAAKTAFEYIKQLLPILAAGANAGEVGVSFDDWFEQPDNESMKERWQDWYRIANSVWTELREERLCAASWVPGALASVKEDLVKVIDRDLIIDLGAELSHIEADLLLEIARTQQVTVFRPTPEWESDYPDGRLAVDWMIKAAEARGVSVTVESAEDTAPAASNNVTYKRLPSGSAEVKEAVARVRQWLEAGVAPDKIGIVAPDLEAYWPVLSLHLEIEGIPANKTVVSMLHSFSDVMRWLARLRIRTGIPEPRDLEVDLFGEASPPLSFNAFREVFSRVYEAADLELSVDLQKHFAAEYSDRGRWSESEIVGRDAFLLKALTLLRENDDSSRAIRLFKMVLEECPPDINFDSQQWVRYLGELAARIEIPVLAADPFGISCLNLASLEGVECTHVMIMGLHEGALRSQHGTVIQTFDLRSIERGTGFVIDGEDRKRVEFEARWILSQPRNHTYLLFADADLGGTVQTPSWSWISGAWAAKSKTPEIEVPAETRFDLLQRRDPVAVGSSAQRERAAREIGAAPQPTFAAGLLKKLSATTIDQVSKCALRFAFDRILGPRDEGTLDLDADRSRHGRLQHKIFELLGLVQWRAHTDDELIAVIEAARGTLGDEGAKIVRTEQAWLSLRRRLLKTARWMLEFEQEQRRRWPNLKTLGTEVSFVGTVGKNETQITGQIDRVDSMGSAHGSGDVDRLIVIDYKSSAIAQNFSSWKKKNFWQPLIYAYAIEKGWIDRWADGLSAKEAASRLAGIFIYDIRKRTKGTGLRLSENNEDIFDFKARSKGQIREDLDKAFVDLERTIEIVDETLATGRFLPVPANIDECDRCKWRSSCRAPHLELA